MQAFLPMPAHVNDIQELSLLTPINVEPLHSCLSWHLQMEMENSKYYFLKCSLG